MSEEDQIRRLLADARHSDPIPSEVAARMDGVIADLHADRPDRATVASLASARRRRRARTMLIAAAVVVVAGIGIDQLRGISVSGGGDDSGAGSSVSGDSATSAEQGGGGRTERGGRIRNEAPTATAPRDFRGAPRIDPDHFAAQAEKLQLTRQAYDGAHTTDGNFSAEKSADCPLPGPGRAVPVIYGHAKALLVYRPVQGDTQVVDLVGCGSSGITRSITLPAP